MATNTTPTVETPIEPEAVTEAPAVETPIEPEAVTEAPAVEASIEPEAVTETPAVEDPIAPAPEGAQPTAEELSRLRQLVGLIEENRFMPIDELSSMLQAHHGLTLNTDGPHAICTMAGVTATSAGGDGLPALIVWCNAARRELLRAEG